MKRLGLLDKLNILAHDYAGDLDGAAGTKAAPCGLRVPKNTKIPGIMRLAGPGGCRVNLMRVLQTNACAFNCSYCPLRAGNTALRREAFKPDELARAFDWTVRRRYADGLFLTSAIPGNAAWMMDRMLETLEIVRTRYHYRGYIHIKILPGSREDQVRRALELASRVSVNLEKPTPEALSVAAPQKQLADIRAKLELMGRLARDAKLEGKRLAPAGITTQFMVGPGGERDREILQTVEELERAKFLRHAHFSAFYPMANTPFEATPPTPAIRSYRLYQAEHLMREYGFATTELQFTKDGNLPLEVDPKVAWALAHPELFPIEVTRATKLELLRIPGVGPISAERIIRFRSHGIFRLLEDFKKIGVRIRRAQYFMTLRGKKLTDTLNLFRNIRTDSAPPAHSPVAKLFVKRIAKNLGILPPDAPQLQIWPWRPLAGPTTPGQFR